MADGVSLHEARQIADLIRIEIMYSMELSASLGVSYNLIFSKIGSDLNKPNGITIIDEGNYRDVVWPLDVGELLFVGDVRKRTLTGYGLRTIGDIAKTDPEYLVKILRSRVGYDLWQFANGDDRNFKPEIDSIGSIGNTITPPADLRSDDEVSAVIYMLASAVCARLRKNSLRTRCVAISMRDSSFNKINRQSTFEQGTDSVTTVFNRAYGLFKAHYKWEIPLRSIGIRTTNLDCNTQLSLFEDENCDTMDVRISERIKKLNERFGSLQIEGAGALERW